MRIENPFRTGLRRIATSSPLFRLSSETTTHTRGQNLVRTTNRNFAIRNPPIRNFSNNRWLLLFVANSFLVYALAVVVYVGLEATPWETTNRAGTAMGFNDTFDREHFGIMIGNFSVGRMLRLRYIYEWILLLAHVGGALLLLRTGPECSRFTRWYFAAQFIVFPVGLLALVTIFPIIASFGWHSPLDRESFIDVPFFLFTAQPVWLGNCLVVAVALRGRGLGLTWLTKPLRHSKVSLVQRVVAAVG